MLYLAIIFVPPVYFIARQKWGGLVLNGILYFIACCCVVTFVGIPLGILQRKLNEWLVAEPMLLNVRLPPVPCVLRDIPKHKSNRF
jgi:hypothetical protein